MILFLAFLWFFCIGWGYYERQETIENQTEYLQQLNFAVAEHANGLLKLSEMSLNTANQWLAAAPNQDILASPQFVAVATNLRQTSDGLLDLLMIEADGTINTIPPSRNPVRAQARDRDYFAARTSDGSAGLFIGKPVVGRKTGEWLIPLTLVSDQPAKGRFPITTINIARLVALHDQQRMRPGGTVTLARTDGLIVARAPFDAKIINSSLAKAANFQNMWLRQDRNIYISDAPVTDGVPRLISYVRLKDYPLFVSMSARMEDVLAPWTYRVNAVVGVAGLITLLAIGMAAFLLRTLNSSDSSRQRFADIAETASDLVWEVDEDTRFTFISNRYKQVLGLEEHQIIGRTAEELGWRLLDAFHAQAFTQVMAARQPFTDLRFKQSLGNLPEKTVSVSGRPFFNGDGSFAGYRGITTDITERIQQEQERKAQAERQAQTSKMEALGQLAGGIAHDFNNLLGAILGFAQFLVQDSPAGSQQRRYAERVVMAGQRGRGLVQQILTFSRRAPGSPVDMTIAELVSETCELLTATIPSTTNLHVETNPDGDELAVTADRTQLGQVLLNLCINASDALEGNAGDIRITVTATDQARPALQHLPHCAAKPTPMLISAWTDTDGFDWIATGGLTATDNVSIIVADTGSGIAKQHQPTLFDLFFTTKDKGGGSGLGLPVVHRIVTDHGGALLVKTKPGSGTIFEVILPRAHLDVVSGTLPPPAERSLPSDRNATILLIDDDEDFCSMLETALHRLGYDVAAVNDPAQGLAAIEEDPSLWDMLITDQTMPHMKGTALVQRAKAIKPDICCIICTGYSSSLNEHEAIIAGADAFCTKPIDVSQFGSLVHALLMRINTKII